MTNSNKITAAEAKKISDNGISSQCESILSYLYASIRKAAMSNSNSIRVSYGYFNTTAGIKARKVLESDGFIIDTYSGCQWQNDNGYTTISW